MAGERPRAHALITLSPEQYVPRLLQQVHLLLGLQDLGGPLANQEEGVPMFPSHA